MNIRFDELELQKIEQVKEICNGKDLQSVLDIVEEGKSSVKVQNFMRNEIFGTIFEAARLINEDMKKGHVPQLCMMYYREFDKFSPIQLGNIPFEGSYYNVTLEGEVLLNYLLLLLSILLEDCSTKEDLDNLYGSHLYCSIGNFILNCPGYDADSYKPLSFDDNREPVSYHDLNDLIRNEAAELRMSIIYEGIDQAKANAHVVKTSYNP